MRGKYPGEPAFYDDHEENEHNNQLAPHEHLVEEPDHESGVEDGDVGDQGDDDSEDDLMEKASSSPSIDDGKYALPLMLAPAPGLCAFTSYLFSFLNAASPFIFPLVSYPKEGHTSGNVIKVGMLDAIICDLWTRHSIRRVG